MEGGSTRGTIILSCGWTESHRGKELSTGLEDHFRNIGFRVSRSESMLPDFILSYAGAGTKRFSSAVKVIREEDRDIMSDQEEQIVRKMASTFQSAYVLVEGRMKGNKLFHHATRSLCGRPPVISFGEGKELCALLDSFILSSKLLPRLQPEQERSAIAGCQETILESMLALPGVSNMHHAKLLARAFGSIANFTIQCKKIRPTLMPGSEIHGKQDLEALSKICQVCSVALWNCEGHLSG